MAKKVLELNVDFKEQSKLGDNGSFLLQPLERGCLLYTSPSPRDLMRSRMPSSA